MFVHPDYRGLGLHSKFLEVAMEQAKIEGASSMWTTVSPDNFYSYRNFEKAGFVPHKKGVVMYGGRVRDILKIKLR